MNECQNDGALIWDAKKMMVLCHCSGCYEGKHCENSKYMDQNHIVYRVAGAKLYLRDSYIPFHSVDSLCIKDF